VDGAAETGPIERPAPATDPVPASCPPALILVLFLLLPMVALVVVSFFDYDSIQIIPAFIVTNYTDALSSTVTWQTYLNTLRYTVIVWGITVVLGFTVAYRHRHRAVRVHPVL
jgi:putative spermidine/putrescine transport system permease protein